MEHKEVRGKLVGMVLTCATCQGSGFITVHFFCSVQMVIVSKNHGFKWFAVVMVFTLSRMKMDGSGETRFAAVRFTVPD